MGGLAGSVFTGSISSATVILVASALLVRLRTARVVDLGLAALGAYGASVFFELRESGDLVLPILGLPGRLHLLDRPTVGTALILALVPSVLVAMFIQRFLLEPLRERAPVNSLAASLGVFLYFQELIQIRFPSASLGVRTRRPVLGQERVTWGTFTFGRDGIVLLGVAVAIAVLLHLLFTRSRFGRIADAANSNAFGALSIGLVPGRIAAVGSGVATVIVTGAIVLAEPVVGTGPSASLLVVPGLAAVLLGGERSFLATAAGAASIGIGQSLILTLMSGERGDWFPNWISMNGVATLIPTVVMVAVATMRRDPSRRSDARDLSFQPRAPRPGPVPYELVAIAVVAALALLGGVASNRALAVSAGALVLYLSVVVSVGYSGQLSLLPVTTAGVGALVYARTFAQTGSFAAAVGLGLLAALATGGVAATIVSRLTGATVALVTLASAVTIQGLVLDSGALLVGVGDAEMASGPRSVFGVPVGSATMEGVSQARLFAAFCVGVAVVCLLLVRVLRRSVVGARMVADKLNPVKAAVFGVDGKLTRGLALVVASFLSGVSGIVAAMSVDRPSATSFMVVGSIVAIALTTLGGTGFIAGAMLAAAITPDGLLTFLTGGSTDPRSQATLYISALSGVALTVTIAASPDGVVGSFQTRWRRFTRRSQNTANPFGPLTRQPTPYGPVVDAPPSSGVPNRGRPPVLEVEALSVSRCGRAVLDDVSLRVEPGEVVGILGRNGAGKTTLFDACSALTPIESGAVSLGGDPLDTLDVQQRFRRGLARVFQSRSSFGSLSAFELTQVAGVQPESVGIDASEAGAELGSLDLGESLLVDLRLHRATKPQVWLLDEPTRGLDEQARKWLLGFVEDVTRLGAGVLLVDHDAEFVSTVSDRVMTLHEGRLSGRGDHDDHYDREDLTGPPRSTSAGASGTDSTVLAHRSGRPGCRPVGSDNLVAGDLQVLAGEVYIVDGPLITGDDVIGNLRDLFGRGGEVLGHELSPGCSLRGLLADMSGPQTHLAELSRGGLALLASRFALFSDMTVWQNLSVAKGGRRISQDDSDWLERNFPELVCLKSSPAGVLSGGEQQLLLLARSLIRRPRLVVASEPFAGLHPSARDRMEILLDEFVRDGGAVVVSA